MASYWRVCQLLPKLDAAAAVQRNNMASADSEMGVRLMAGALASATAEVGARTHARVWFCTCAHVEGRGKEGGM